MTCDNGVEFQDFKGIEQSVYSKKKKRTKVYFVHPYSSFERGSNENANRLIRRFLPKGTTFDELSQRVVQRLARGMNKIPRKLFDGKSANEMVKALGLNFGDAKH
ncbi:MAG: IS30 family transposase [Akkermansiaceae bacterium]|nr:IS30 family transposase [Akkermansiaceae bacterium]